MEAIVEPATPNQTATDGRADAGLDLDWRDVIGRMREGFVVGEVVRRERGPDSYTHRYVNAAWRRITGLDDAEVYDRPVEEVFPSLEREWIETFVRVVDEREAVTFTRHSEVTGQTYDCHAFPLPGDRFGILFVDVTDRVEASERVEEHAQSVDRRLAGAVSDQARTWAVTPDMMVVFDMEGRFEQVNPAWTVALGYSQEQMPGVSLFDLLHPDDVDRTNGALADVNDDRPVLRFENRYRHADGGYRWLSWVAVPEGERIYCSARDVTEERARAAALVERDQFWRASRDLWVVIGTDGLYRQVNPAWRSRMGYEPDALIGRPFGELTHPDDQARGRDAFGALLGGETLDGFECRVRTADGDHRWTEWSAYLEGDLVYALGRDVEDRKAREAELAAAEQALRQAQKMEMIGQLTGGVAHDFNNLLMAVQSSLTLAQKRLPEGDARTAELIGNAVKGTERGAALTQRMLAFARRQDLAEGPVSIPDLLYGMDDLLRRSLGPRIKVEVDVAPGTPPALADANQLEMAILNLAVNARDAMEGEGTLRLSVAKETVGADGQVAPGEYVRLLVTDTGSGMDEETLGRAAEPFFTTKGVGKGTGLGLSMIHGLAEQSGGAFRLSSVLGVGTTAEIVLPVATASGTSSEPVPSAPAKARPLKVLAVDDDFLVLMGTTGMLEDLGHEVVEAASGAEALDAVARHDDLDLVLTDQAMPGMTGTELVQALRAVRPNLPVILATGYAELPEGAEALVLARLGKPFSEKSLAEALATV